MKQKTQFPALTSLKGLFILVIAFHNTMLVHPLFASVPGAAFMTVFGGALGDSMFFILSGFLLSYSYRDSIMSHSILFQDYLGRRLRKLYPLYFITNLAAFFLDVLQYGLSAINLKKMAFTLLLQMGGGLDAGNPYNSPTWFVSALFLCYILFFFICHYSKTSTHYYCAITVCVILGYTLLGANLSVPFCYPGTGDGLMNFFIGCILAEVYPRISRNIHRWLQPLSLFVLPVSFFLFLRYGTEIICGNPKIAFSFVICPLILYLAMVEGPCSRILQCRPFVYLGKISVSIFFWHLVVYSAFRYVFTLAAPNGVIQESHYLLYAAAMLLWSACFHRFFQQKRQKK